ncbi:MAG: tRNA (adenosine(37)-N6)-threonylcarbamoyltransferase complex transferase subunit TsaD [Alphaproteobacteria bacterium 41-28]|nr:MAG: tRNA (adenosine(37)-N6)-threonylcarbamoyltransferase complex transferase subunit TsaD [Alphaproteobacteria bacterium 41-28]
MIILGIETSCDETAAALVTDDKRILSNIVSSQFQEHKPFGGVVPEIAARAHLIHIEFIIQRALQEANLSLDQIDGVAATGGPGLIGGVIVGVMIGKGLAMAKNIPFIPINHLEAHALTARLTGDVPFPYLLLLVSGGHCQFLIVEDVGVYTYLGGTLDDAIGECLDKTARLLGYPYPGGPTIEKLALTGNPEAFALPHPLKGQNGCSFSFSGLKTAARKIILENEASSPSFQADFCASLQKTIGEILVDRCHHAVTMALEKKPDIVNLVLAGGVAANQYFRKRLENCSQERGLTLITPPVSLCTDNGAMIAWAGVEHLNHRLVGSLTFAPRPRWPLENLKSEIGEKS